MSQVLQCTQLAALICRRLPLRLGGIVDDLVDASRAEARAGVAVFLGAAGDADVGVEHLQVHRLVFVVLGRGEVDAGEAVARG